MNPEDELRALEQLLDELLRGIQEALQSGEVLSDEFQGMLAQEIEQTTTRIDQLNQEIGQAQGTPPLPEPTTPTEQTTTPSLPPIQPPTPPAPPLVPITDAQRLTWILAGSNIDAFVHYLDQIPDPELNALLRNPAQLDQVIRTLHETEPKGEPPSQDGIQRAGLQSSNIYGFQYDPQKKKLLVRFQGGPVYSYDGVPMNIYKIFQQGAVPAKTQGANRYGMWWRGKQPSLGATFYEMIRKGGYPYQRLR